MEHGPNLPSSEVLIVGAGVIGLSLALELRWRGAEVAVFDQGAAMAGSSTAAAGMLAADDPYNPLELQPLSRLSASLYASFLARINEISGLAVPFQTNLTLQTLPGGALRQLPEHSIDPRQLAPALLLAAKRSGVHILEHTSYNVAAASNGKQAPYAYRTVVYATGAYPCAHLPVVPRKGQMLRVRVPVALNLQQVYRAEHIYVVPRTEGPQAGTALIGATIEDAGFDTHTSPAILKDLRTRGAELVPALADEQQTPAVEAWAGLRPATPDGLPILGELSSTSDSTHTLVATGHFRNGILLAPATAVLLADLIEDRPPQIDLTPFAPARFSALTDHPVLSSART